MNFYSFTYARTRQEPRFERPVKPLMRAPHLTPHFGRVPLERGRVQRYQPAMYPPRPLMEPSFFHPRDRRPNRDFSDRRPPPPGRQSYPTFHRSRSEKAKPLDWNWRRPRV